MTNAIPIAIEELGKQPYTSVICYPRLTKPEAKKRLGELRKLGVDALVFGGKKQVSNVPVLGKGCVGIVVVARRGREEAALKIRRTDADRGRMHEEAMLLKAANSAGVGPEFLWVSRDFLLMQFIDGDLLPKWLEKRRGKTQVKKVLREILEQCWSLDKAGLDHGELSHAPKHVIIDREEKPFIVDFETASLDRRPSNVTSICQFLFISGTVADSVADKVGSRNREMIIEALRRYKNDRVRVTFERVVEACGL